MELHDDALVDRLNEGLFQKLEVLSQLDSIDLTSKCGDSSRWATCDTGYVYLIQCGQNGPIKIGTAWNPFRRMKLLQTGNHRRLFLRAVFIDTNPSLEFVLHEHFKESRIRGEWFRPTIELNDFIEWLNSPGLVSWERSFTWGSHQR